jgi:Tol biopolymer transport system component
MKHTAWAGRVASPLTMCAAAALVAVGGGEMAGQVVARATQLVATQRIRGGAADTLRPAALSPDGRLIAFGARDREPSERSCCHQIYVLDRSTGVITLESVGADGTPADGDSQAPSLDANGRVIAFETVASNLLFEQPRFTERRVIVRNRLNGVLRTPQGPSGNGEPDGGSGEPVVSGNGLTVVFTSDTTNLVTGPDANGRQTDIYLWSLDDLTISRISVDDKGVQQANSASHSPSVSRDGNLVAFVSTARLVSEDTNELADVYLRDVRRGRTSLVSGGIDRSSFDGPSHSPALSADGRYVAFVSKAGNLGPRDRNQDMDVYVYDVAAGSITLVSATSKGEAANAASRRPAISADGRYVVYQSVASNLGSGSGCPRPVSDTNLLADVYLLDRTTRCVTRVSGSPAVESWTPSVAPAINGSGAVVVFSSTQPVSEDDVSTDFDLFLFVRASSDTSAFSDRHSRASRCCH